VLLLLVVCHAAPALCLLVYVWASPLCVCGQLMECDWVGCERALNC
jgi:hypothetical protein